MVHSSSNSVSFTSAPPLEKVKMDFRSEESISPNHLHVGAMVGNLPFHFTNHQSLNNYSSPANVNMFDPSKPPLVAETLLKKRRSLEDLAIIRSETVQKQKTRKRVVRGEDIKLKRPEQFLKEFRIREGSKNKMMRRKKKVERKTKAPLIPKNSMKGTVGVAVRIHGGKFSSPIIKNELEKLGLNKKYDAVFFKLDRSGIGTVASIRFLPVFVAYFVIFL